jgi:hypothetical protein
MKKTAKEILSRIIFSDGEGEDYCNVIMAMEEYAEQSNPKWISVKYKLPMNNEKVIGLTINENIDSFRFSSSTQKFGIGDDEFIVTHWMPLPEKPEE